MTDRNNCLSRRWQIRTDRLSDKIAQMMSMAHNRTWRKGLNHLRKNDPKLARIITRAGPYSFELEDGYYESLVGAIVFQQLAGNAAQAILNRFKQLYGGKFQTQKPSSAPGKTNFGA